MFGKNAFKTKRLILLSLVLLAGCQSTKDEVSIRSENIEFSSKQSAAVTLSHRPAAENPINAAKREGVKPAKVSIPAIGVEAAVQHLGTTKAGAMAVPDDINEVSWFEPGYRPGQNGRAVIAGHVDGLDGPAIFWNLTQLKEGDKIIVEGEGEQLTFQVYAMESVPLEQADVSSVFGYTSSPELVLITCSGVYSHSMGTREERLFVYASHIEE
ncbi:class F sortase [Planomicrobium sp. CPCC 101079]|uniref:class F sortase n=1 Tax=Planomicrobium sp. CPCC 101079 TaxID=2599618 RepID=UPI0011B41D43|nr:class F sortase [Planomicrobium sp. CPCC 101079]TWT14580.1 class F sortase [Planomicrobium sp. CPCC 101079]